MEKRETLLARSERIIGKSLEEGANSRPKRSLSRRREQVLQAQRAHRHRTQQYIRELEKEVLHLRDENEAMLRRVQRQSSQLLHLKATLIKHEIPVGIDLDIEPVGEGGHSATNALDNRDQPHAAHVRVDLGALARSIPQGSCENHPAEIAPPVYQMSHDNREPRVPSEPPLDTQKAIDFILTLEQPCLPHVKHAHLGYSTGTTPRGIDYNSGPAHLLTTSASICHLYHSQDPNETILNLPKPDLERLLHASARLQLDNEITPVQIWARIRAVSPSTSITGSLLQRLTSEFVKYVYCNSFGAVVEKSTAIAILANMLDNQEL